MVSNVIYKAVKCLVFNISTKHTVLSYSVVQNQSVINKGKEKMHCNSFLGKCVEICR